jgi:hypothetical protein
MPHGPAPGKLLLDRRAQRLAEITFHPEQMLTTAQLAAWLEVSVAFLEIARTKGPGFGPPYKKGPGRRGAVRYRCADVVEWLKSRTRTCTAEYKSSEVA